MSVNSPGIGGVSPEEEKEGYGGKDLQKMDVLSLEWKKWGVVDDESGESTGPTEEVPLMRWVKNLHGWRREKPGVDSRDEGKHTGRNNQLFVDKMM